MRLLCLLASGAFPFNVCVSDESTGSLVIKTHAASVNTGSGTKNRKLKSNDFFDVEQNPLITFVSNKFVEISPGNYEVDGPPLSPK